MDTFAYVVSVLHNRLSRLETVVSPSENMNLEKIIEHEANEIHRRVEEPVSKQNMIVEAFKVIFSSLEKRDEKVYHTIIDKIYSIWEQVEIVILETHTKSPYLKIEYSSPNLIVNETMIYPLVETNQQEMILRLHNMVDSVMLRLQWKAIITVSRKNRETETERNTESIQCKKLV